MTETLYLAEMTTTGGRQWWPGVGDRCAPCGGRLALEPPLDVRDRGRLYCLLCGRNAALVGVQRPAPVPRGLFGGEPRRGGPQKPVAKDASICREPACPSPREAGRSLCSKHRTDRYRERVLESGRGCARPGCDEPVHVFGATTRYCRAHNSEHRRALRQGRAS